MLGAKITKTHTQEILISFGFQMLEGQFMCIGVQQEHAFPTSKSSFRLHGRHTQTHMNSHQWFSSLELLLFDFFYEGDLSRILKGVPFLGKI